MLKLKVTFFNRKLFKNYLSVLSILSLFFSFAVIVIDISDDLKLYIGISLALLLIIVFIIIWICANLQKRTTLLINNSTMIVKTGNIFEEAGLKVIAFNQYFDTLVDNKIIADNSLNGIYITSKIDDVSKLDALIENDEHLKDNVLETFQSRPSGKNKRYKLGTIFLKEDYLLTAFTKFDKDNRAYLSMHDYIDFLLNFWNEIDIIYAGRSVSIPLLGSGITRFKEYSTISEQELVELLIWSFKISRIKFTYPSKVSIIIDESKKDKINFYKLKED